MTPEGRVESHLKTQCDKKGILCYKFQSPSNSGVPDRVLVANGKVVFLELKRPGETPRKLQQHVIKRLKKAGATVYVADNNDDVDAILKELLS
mgnify:CR=1 FL=1